MGWPDVPVLVGIGGEGAQAKLYSADGKGGRKAVL